MEEQPVEQDGIAEKQNQQRSDNSGPASIPESYFEQNPKSHKKHIIILAVTLGVMVLGAGIYWFIVRNEPENNSNTQANNPEQQIKQDFATTPSASDTKKYTSVTEGLNLSFDYPSNWQVSVVDDEKDKTMQYVQVSSTNFSLTNAEGQPVTGKVVMTMRPKGSNIPELASGNATIAQDSQQIGYKKPTPSQRQYPYVSFVHLQDTQFSNNPFEQVIITGGRLYKKNETITSAKLQEVDPLISFTVYLCKSDACTDKDNTPLSITDEAWKNNQNLQLVKTLLESLVIN
jgi:hypothetical protein